MVNSYTPHPQKAVPVLFVELFRETWSVLVILVVQHYEETRYK